MNARAVLKFAPASRTPPVRNPEPMRGERMQLSPIAWGTPNRELARGICQNILEITPPTVIPFDPRTHAGMRKELRSLGINH